MNGKTFSCSGYITGLKYCQDVAPKSNTLFGWWFSGFSVSFYYEVERFRDSPFPPHICGTVELSDKQYNSGWMTVPQNTSCKLSFKENDPLIYWLKRRRTHDEKPRYTCSIYDW